MKTLKHFNLISIILSMTLLLSVCVSVSANQPISVYLNNEKISFDVDPIIVNDRAMVPMRAIFEKLGAEVSWDGTTSTATAYKDTIYVSITIGASKMYKIARPIQLDAPAMIVDGRTLIPLRAISEAFNCEVQWDANTRTVTIYSDDFVDFSKATDTQEEVKVSTAEQLLNSIGSNKKIILTSNYYNLSTAQNVNNEHVEKQLNWDNTYFNAYVFKNVVNMTIEGNAEIVIDDINADVLHFERCGNITLSGLTVGHTTYYEKYACEGAVTEFNICDSIYINNCNLFGCGAIGISTNNVRNLQVNNSKIYECSFTGMHLTKTTATIKNTEFFDSTHWGGFVMLSNSVADFDKCDIHDIKTGSNTGFSFIDISDIYNSNETKATFNNCNFYNNSFIDITNAKTKQLVFNNCEFKNNIGNTIHPAVINNN